MVGWARETRLQAKNTLLFIKLVDGSNVDALQVVVQDSVPNWEEVKKANTSYSFKLTGKIEKSMGQGQTIELKLKGEPFEKIQVFGRCDDEKYPLHSRKINL